MFPVPKPCLAILATGLLSFQGTLAEQETKLSKLSQQQLEENLLEIGSEINRLARYSLRSGAGAVGYRSVAHDESEGREWIQINLDKVSPIEQIVLAPILWRDAKSGFRSDGFPAVFRILAGTDDESEGTEIARFDLGDKLLPRVAPLVIQIKETSASWVRLETTELSRRAFDQRFILQLSEIMIFSGEQNIALRRPVNCSSRHPRDLVHAWDKKFLVDGHMPYLMDAAQGEPSTPFITSVGRHPAFIIDLGKVYPISEIHLHAVDQSATAPQAYPGNLGIPLELLVEGATQSDFSDATALLKILSGDASDTGPVMMWAIPETNCRFVRIRSPDVNTRSRFGFAEIEVLSGGHNVALNKTVFLTSVNKPAPNPGSRFSSALTDGRNLYGNILPIRTWIDQLARRHEVEAKRPKIVAELNQRYAKQQKNLLLMTWVAALLAAAVGFTILIDRMLRMRQAARMRERFAADLHDELGANIHTIGLLGDLAREAESRDELLELLDRSREFTERSGVAIRNCTNMLEEPDLCGNLVDEMNRSAGSLLADIKHSLSFDGKEFLTQLSQRRRIDIFFFYKECLTNIIRHSGATKASTKVEGSLTKVTLTITDNGSGLEGSVPISLKRRARLLRAKLVIRDAPGGGTRISLCVPRSWSSRIRSFLLGQPDLNSAGQHREIET
ncbi:MAG: ATP-binding protein [Luteolibacter sp.]